MTFATSTIGLKYGHRDLRVALPVSRAFDVCAPRHAQGLPEPEAAVRASLRAPVGSAPLRDKARGGRSAVVLISARDRVTGSDCFVKVIADELNAAGIPDGAIEVVLASGTHQKQTEEDVRSLLGPEAAGRLRASAGLLRAVQPGRLPVRRGEQAALPTPRRALRRRDPGRGRGAGSPG